MSRGLVPPGPVLMDAVPFGSAESAILSIAGAIFALVGLWILLRSGGRTVQCVAALGVFLVGAAVLVLPWVWRGPPAAQWPAPAPDPMVLAPVGITLSDDGLRTVATSADAPGPPPPLPGREAARIAIQAAEAEPNDNLAMANVAALGTAIAGTLDGGDLDYFAVDVPAGIRGEIVVNLLVLEGDAELTLFDDAGQALGSVRTRSALNARAVTLVRKIDRPRYHALVLAVPAAPATYQLTVAARRR